MQNNIAGGDIVCIKPPPGRFAFQRFWKEKYINFRPWWLESNQREISEDEDMPFTWFSATFGYLYAAVFCFFGLGTFRSKRIC